MNLIINNQLTNAADVLFGKGVVDLQMALFAGTERLTFIDIARENGNIFKLINEAEKYVKHFMKWSVKFGKMQREEIPEIPIEAIREAIVNSFAHRDYRNINNNEIAIFKDRIEIFNPGSFPEGFTPEDFIKGRQSSILRNKLIAQILYFSKDIENWGSGIRRIYELCKQNGVKVDFKITKAGFLVVFHRKVFEGENAVIREDEFSDSFTVIFSDMFTENFTENFSKAQKKILVAIFKSPKITQERLAEIVGISRRSIVSNMNKLKELGVIKRVGSDRQGRWEIKK